MESQPNPYKRCAAHFGDVAAACELIRRLTHGEIQDAVDNAPKEEWVAQQTDTITKSVVALGVLGCAHSKGDLITQLTEWQTPTS